MCDCCDDMIVKRSSVTEHQNGNMVCVMCNNKTDSFYKGVPICDKCQHKFATELEYADPKNIGSIQKLVDGVSSILDGLHDLYGIDPNNENFIDTPKRVARLMMELNYGTNVQASKDIMTVSFPSDNKYSGMISCSNIRVSSLCPHHLVVVNYDVSMAYVPAAGRCIGLSKLPRLAKTLAKSMLLQEDYTNKLADMMMSQLKPAGCAVMVSGVHNCVQARGVEMRDVNNVTCELRGTFALNPELKKEWLYSIKRN